jgi:hypothetical protein
MSLPVSPCHHHPFIQPEASTSGSNWVPVAEQRVLAHQQSKPKKKKNKKKK